MWYLIVSIPDLVHPYLLGLFFGVQNFEFRYVLGVFRKINIFLAMKIL